MNILITGVAGLLGSRLSDWIIKNKSEYTVIGIDDLSGVYKENINPNVKFLEMNLVDDSLSYVFQKYKIDYVFHFAAYAAEGLSPFIRCYNYDNNLKATANIVNQCIKYDVKRLVFTSTLAVYGHGYGGIFDEEQIPKPIDPYGVAKFACEMDIQIAGEQHGLDWCIIRPHNVYGIKQNIWDKYRNVIGIFIRRAINNQPLLVYGDGEQTRAFSDIQYYMKPFHMLRRDTHNGEIFNLGADQEYRLIDVAKMVKSVANMYFIDAKIKHVEPRHEVKNAYCDHSKAKFLLNFEDKTDLKDLISKMFRWAMSEPERSVKKFKYEVKKGIYEYWK